MHVLDNRLVAPGAKLADGSGHHVEAAAAAGYLEQVNGPVEHSCCLFDVALADVCEGQIPKDDRLRLVTTMEAAGGALQDRPRLGAVAKGEIAGALNPSEAVGGEKAVGGIGSSHCLEMCFGGAKGGLTFPAVAEHGVALAGM
jgi:hypothetical protein